MRILTSWVPELRAVAHNLGRHHSWGRSNFRWTRRYALEVPPPGVLNAPGPHGVSIRVILAPLERMTDLVSCPPEIILASAVDRSLADGAAIRDTSGSSARKALTGKLYSDPLQSSDDVMPNSRLLMTTAVEIEPSSGYVARLTILAPSTPKPILRWAMFAIMVAPDSKTWVAPATRNLTV